MSASEARGVLGLAEGAGAAELRRAFLAAVKTAHPDRAGGDAERLRQVIEAHAVLGAAPSSAPTVARRSPPRPEPTPAEQRLTITPAEAMLGGRRALETPDRGTVLFNMPAGLRSGDRVAAACMTLQIQIDAAADASVVGDHLCFTVRVARSFLRFGGILQVETPAGLLHVKVTPEDALRGLARVHGAGLPARGRHAQGHLFVRLEAVAEAPPFSPQIDARTKLRRFFAAWAA